MGIRSESGVEGKREYEARNRAHWQGCQQRAALFASLHPPADDIFFAIDVNDDGKGRTIKRKLRNFSPFVQKSFPDKIAHQEMPYIFPEDDEEGRCKTLGFTWRCKTSDVKSAPMGKAVCDQDSGVKPGISNRVYFINIGKGTIFHICDDRGCDLSAASPETISGVDKRYNGWIFDDDRPEIEKRFIGYL